MKARIPMLSKNDMKKIKAEIKRELDNDWEKREEEITEGITRRIFKVMFYVLYKKHGYGQNRSNALLGEFMETLDRLKTDEVFFEHIDQIAIDYLKLPLERDYTERGRAV